MVKRRPVKTRTKRRTSKKAQPRVVKQWKKPATRSTRTTLRRAASRRASPSTSNRDDRRLVLLVEDDASARSGYAEFLTDNGFRVLAVGAALVALEHASTEVPDVVLTDIALPDQNGFDLTRALKRDPRLAAVRVIGLTGHWSSDASRDARGAGMAALLLKPVAPPHLLAEVNRVLGQKA
jgi:CheY-like chemotaxis protein